MTISQDSITGLEPGANPVVDNTRVGMMVFETGSGRILGANAAAARQFGTVDQPLAGVTIDHFFQPLKGKGSLQSWLAERPAESLTELSAQRPDGSRFPVWASFNALPDADPPLTAILFHDITEQKAREESLRQREERYELAMRGANDGIWDWDIRASRVFFSPRWKSMLGYEEGDIGSAPQDWFSRVHPDDVRELRRVVGKAHSGGSPNFVHEYRIRRKDGTYAWVLLRGVVVSDESGKPSRMAGSQTDVSAQKHSEDRLQHEALHDALTGLPNRSMFMDRLKHAIRRNRRHTDQLFAVLFLDLDRFKVINDSLGHLIGDQLLIEVSERLRGSVRSYDVASRVNDSHPSSGMVSRLGGDEFAILLDGLRRPEDAARVAERIQQRLQEPLRLANNEIYTSTSIGIAVCKGDYDRADELLRDADTAMYRAKSLGKARYAIFDDTLHGQALNRLQWEGDLHRALERDEFVMYYQPIVALDTGTLNAFESLIRWQHPDKGLLSPADFMKIAEETGLVARMGWWAFGEALRQQGAWLKQAGEAAPRYVSVNLSSKEIMHPSIVAQIEEALTQANLDANALNIEITETVIVDNPQSIADTLGRLRDLGVRLSLDDFGTGYSSLSYLHEFPIENVKIDRHFVRDIGPDNKKNEIAAAIIRLCHNLGLTVTAEGVETHSQLACLRTMGCDYIQGYLFAPPLPSDEASDLLGRGALTPES